MTFKRITEGITKGTIKVDNKDLNFNEYMEDQSKKIKIKYEDIENKIRHKFIILDILFDPMKRMLGIFFIIMLNITLFMFFMIYDTPNWAKAILLYFLFTNLIKFLMRGKHDKEKAD